MGLLAVSYQFPVTIDQELLEQYREELQWANQEVEILAITLERSPDDMVTVEKVRDIIQDSWMSSVKLDLIPLSESLADTLKGLDFLLDWQVYPPRMTEFVLMLIDRVMDIAREVEEYQFIDMRKTQAILVALQYIILAKSVDEITQGIENAINAISQDINAQSDTGNNNDEVVLFDDGVDLFDEAVELFDDTPASPAPVVESPPDIFVPNASLNPLHQARDFIRGHSDENCLSLLGHISESAERHYNSHKNFLLELALATNILAGEPLDNESLYKGACLHDIALTSSPDLFDKEHKLKQDEIQELKLHPVKSAELAHELNLSSETELFVIHHHEHIDGSGYPFGLKGDNISEQGKLAAIVDTFHNAIEKHAVMGARESVLTAILEINIHTGMHYDPQWSNLFNLLLRDYWLPDWRESRRVKTTKTG